MADASEAVQLEDLKTAWVTRSRLQVFDLLLTNSWQVVVAVHGGSGPGFWGEIRR